MTRLIGYNDSENFKKGISNLYLSIGAKVLGQKRDFGIVPGEIVYFVYKDESDSKWFVKARAKIVNSIGKSHEPWNDGTDYFRWQISDVFEFPPFELYSVSKVTKQARGLYVQQAKKLEDSGNPEVFADVHLLEAATNALISSLHLRSRS